MGRQMALKVGLSLLCHYTCQLIFVDYFYNVDYYQMVFAVVFTFLSKHHILLMCASTWRECI